MPDSPAGGKYSLQFRSGFGVRKMCLVELVVAAALRGGAGLLERLPRE